MSLSNPIVVASTPEAIYRALLHPASLTEWWGCTAVIDARVGGAWVGGWGEGPDGLGQGTVIWASLAELAPSERVSLLMGETQVAVDIASHAHGASVTVTQTGYPSTDPQEEAQALESWVDMVRSLQAWVEKKHPYKPPAPVKPAPAPALAPAPAQPVAARAQASQPAAAQPAPAQPAAAGGGARVLDDGGFGVTDPHGVIKTWSKEQGFGYVAHAQLGDVVFDYDGCDFEPAPGDKVLLLVIAKAWNGKPKVKRIACPAKGSKLDK